MTKLLIKTDRNGTKYFEETAKCWKCGGTGTYQWGAIINGHCSYAGECYACGGTGVVVTKTKEYTPEHEAKLQAQREKRQAQKAADEARKEAERQAAIDEWKKAQAQREAQWAAERAASRHVFAVGERVDTVVTLNFEHEFDTQFGSMYIYSFKDGEGNTLVWKTSTLLWFDGLDEHGCNIFIRKGDKIRIKATIKAHDEYKGEKQTALTRVKVIEVVEKAQEVS